MSVMDRVQAGGGGAVADRLLADAASAAEAARARVAAAATDIFVAPERRLEDDLRMAMARLVAGVVAVIEDDLRQRLIERLGTTAPPEVIAGLAAAEIGIAAPILDRAGLLGDAELVSALLRRAEVERMGGAFPPPAWPTLLDNLMQSGDEVLAGLAMAVILAAGRGDGAGARPLARTDLAAELQHRLTWWVAAALRHYLVVRGDLAAAVADRALIATATAALAGYDEADTAEGRAVQLARRLHQRKRLDDELILRAIEEGWLDVAVAGLAVRAGIDFAPAWEMATDPGGSRLVVLLRATGFGRNAAAAIVCAVARATGTGDDALEARIDAFDWLDIAAARDAIRPWQCDPGYRDALADLARGLEGPR